jgi:Uncharacterised nucleotidyltransferase
MPDPSSPEPARIHRPAGSFWPTERQTLLLRAAVCESATAVHAWELVRPSLDLETLEAESSSLLPLVQRRLANAGVDDPLLPRLLGMHKRTWYVNQLRLDRLVPALEAVQGAGVEPLVVGGCELAVHYHADLGVRAIPDLQLLVRPEQLAPAARALETGGWTSRHPTRHRLSYKSADGERVVLHARLFHELAGTPRDPWASAKPFELNGTTARMLGHADELLHVCLTGARAGRFPSHMWLADATAVLSCAGAELDWQRLVDEASRLRAARRLHDALVFLSRELDAQVPQNALDELARTRIRARQWLAHRLASRRWPVVGAAPEGLVRLLFVTADRSVPAALVTIPRFVRDEWGHERRRRRPELE